MAEEPLLTVVIPAHNADRTLAEQLRALTHQTVRYGWDVVVVDNNSTDTTASTAKAEGQRGGLTLHILSANESQGAAYARNVGALHAAAPAIAFCDADDVVSATWVEAALDGLSQFPVVTGPLEETRLNDEVSRRFRTPHPANRAPIAGGFLPTASSANMAIRKEVLNTIGGWDESFGHGEDVDLSWRAQRAGFQLGFIKSMTVHYRHRSNSRDLFRQFSAYGVSAAHLYATYRDQGMPPRTMRRTLASYVWLAARLPYLFRTRARRKQYLIAISMAIGRLRGSIRYRVTYL